MNILRLALNLKKLDMDANIDLYKSSLAEYEADPNDPVTRYNLACCYHYGLGTELNYDRAVELYQYASDAGLCEASANLGLLYLYGQGVALDPLKAASLLKSAAEAGSVNAMAALGGILSGRKYKEEFGDTPELGISWLEKASDNNHQVATHNLGLAYVTGVGVEPDQDKGIALLRKSAAQGNELSKECLRNLS